MDARHNHYGTPVLTPSPQRQAHIAGHMRGQQVALDKLSRGVVKRAIEDHCTLRRWRILALNVRTQHVHIVLTHVLVRPELAAGQLKSWATRRLREAGLAPDQDRLWTREASTRYLFFQEAVDGAVVYVLHEQGAPLDK